MALVCRANALKRCRLASAAAADQTSLAGNCLYGSQANSSRTQALKAKMSSSDSDLSSSDSEVEVKIIDGSKRAQPKLLKKALGGNSDDSSSDSESSDASSDSESDSEAQQAAPAEDSDDGGKSCIELCRQSSYFKQHQARCTQCM